MNRILPILIAAVIAIGGAFYMTQNNGSLPRRVRGRSAKQRRSR